MRNRQRKCLGVEALENRVLLATDTFNLPGIHFASPLGFDPFSGPNEWINAAEFIDLNGDGDLDAVFLSNGGAAGSIYVNGQFGELSDLLPLSEPAWGLEAGDVNNDGLVDVVVWGSSTVSVLLGQTSDGGWSGFRLGHSLKTGANSLALGDLDQDGNLDLVLGGTQTVTYAGDGTGKFINAIRYGTPSQNGHVVSLGDADDDGDLDVLTSSNNRLEILRNDGGIFEVALDTIEGDRFGVTALVDMDDDGVLDLWLANTSMEHSLLSLYHGNGDGTFRSSSTIIETLGPVSDLQLADLNSDSRLDVVVGTLSTFHHPINGNGPGGVSVILAKESGAFHPAIRIATPSATSVNVADRNDDGRLDIMATHYDGVMVHHQSPVRWFSETVPAFTVSESVFSQVTTTVGDLNRDSHADYVISLYDGHDDRSEVSIFLGNMDGTFDVQSVFVANAVTRLDIANFDGNFATNELSVVSSSSSTRVSVFGLDVDGQMTSPVISTISNRLNASSLGDMNRDGIQDFVGSSDEISVLLGSASGTFARQSVPFARVGYSEPMIRDFNNDEIPDLMLTNFEGFDLLVGKGDGSFDIATQRDLRFVSVGIGDFDGDTLDDIAYASYSDTSVVLEFGQGDGTFGRRAEAPKVANAEVRVSDLNGDGRSDLLYLQGNRIHAYVNDPVAWRYLGATLLSDYASNIQTVDIDGDGHLETIVSPELGISIPQANLHVIDHLDPEDTSLTITTFSTASTLRSIANYDTNSDERDEIVVTTNNGLLILTADHSISLPCDFDSNGNCSVSDLNVLLYEGFASQDPKFDLDGSATVDLGDRDAFFRQVGSLPGDLNFDGIVDAADLNMLGVNWLNNVSSYANGDVNGDGRIDASDLNEVGLWWQKTADEFPELKASNLTNVAKRAVHGIRRLGRVAGIGERQPTMMQKIRASDVSPDLSQAKQAADSHRSLGRQIQDAPFHKFRRRQTVLRR